MEVSAEHPEECLANLTGLATRQVNGHVCPRSLPVFFFNVPVDGEAQINDHLRPSAIEPHRPPTGRLLPTPRDTPNIARHRMRLPRICSRVPRVDEFSNRCLVSTGSRTLASLDLFG